MPNIRDLLRRIWVRGFRMRWLLLIGFLAVIAYGYWDSHAPYSQNIPVEMNVATLMQLQGDSFAPLGENKRGQLLIRARWTQPEHSKVVSLKLKGKVVENGIIIESFDQPCQRADSTWLRDIKGATECFITLRTVKTITPEGDRAAIAEFEFNSLTLEIADGGYTARVVNNPLRYMIWLEELFAKAQEIISRPFTRS